MLERKKKKRMEQREDNLSGITFRRKFSGNGLFEQRNRKIYLYRGRDISITERYASQHYAASIF